MKSRGGVGGRGVCGGFLGGLRGGWREFAVSNRTGIPEQSLLKGRVLPLFLLLLLFLPISVSSFSSFSFSSSSTSSSPLVLLFFLLLRRLFVFPTLLPPRSFFSYSSSFTSSSSILLLLLFSRLTRGVPPGCLPLPPLFFFFFFFKRCYAAPCLISSTSSTSSAPGPGYFFPPLNFPSTFFLSMIRGGSTARTGERRPSERATDLQLHIFFLKKKNPSIVLQKNVRKF